MFLLYLCWSWVLRWSSAPPTNNIRVTPCLKGQKSKPSILQSQWLIAAWPRHIGRTWPSRRTRRNEEDRERTEGTGWRKKNPNHTTWCFRTKKPIRADNVGDGDYCGVISFAQLDVKMPLMHADTHVDSGWRTKPNVQVVRCKKVKGQIPHVKK